MNPDQPFLFFAGLDGVAPVIHGVRKDQQTASQHDIFWRTDFANVTAIGMKTLRWGPNWYKVNPAPGQYVWDDVDERLAYAKRIGLDIWYVLQHKQCPDFLEKDSGILSLKFPETLRAYGEEVVKRYPHIKTFCISVEPDFYSLISCHWGHWSPHRTDSFHNAIYNFAYAIKETSRAMKKIRPDIQVVHMDFAPGLLLAALVKDDVDAMAIDYYPPHGESLTVWIDRWWRLLEKPIYIGETDMPGGRCDHDVKHQIAWLRSTINDCKEARKRGVPMLGYCPYPTVTDNLYWGSNQCHPYECNFGDGYMGDDAGLFRFKPDKAGVLHRVPVIELVNALREEMENFHVS
jgi:beta-glucosidase/6-phospho-beta-glucosidase/beta-galactosidase